MPKINPGKFGTIISWFNSAKKSNPRYGTSSTAVKYIGKRNNICYYKYITYGDEKLVLATCDSGLTPKQLLNLFPGYSLYASETDYFAFRKLAEKIQNAE